MKIKPDEHPGLDDEAWERIEIFREVVRERTRVSSTVSDRLARLLGRDPLRADVEEIRADLFGDVSLPDSVVGPIDAAAERLEANDADGAREILADAFDSVCDDDPPDAYEVSPTGRTSRCHLHREEYEDPRSQVERPEYAYTD